MDITILEAKLYLLEAVSENLKRRLHHIKKASKNERA